MTDNLFNLTGDVVLVTGGGGLIGAEVCRAIDRHGATVVVAENDEERGREVVQQLDRGEFVHLDITDSASIETVCEHIFTEYGHLDGLVNLAYPHTEDYGQPFESVEKDQMIENISLHLGGYYAMTKTAALKMIEHDSEGTIVNFISTDGMQAPDFTVYEGTDVTSSVEYSILKAGVLNFTKTMNISSTDNISINELADHVIEETGADLERVHEDAKEADSRHTHADVSKARDLIDYEPSVDIREGVSRFIDWYETNREWYEPLVMNS